MARLAMAVVHIATVNQPLRSGFFTLGLLCTLALAGMAVWGAF